MTEGTRRRRPAAPVRAVQGNLARSVQWETAEPQAPAPRRRTPLSLVPAASRRRRVPVAALCFVVLAAGLVAVLLLNISVSSGQYQLVQLQNQRTELLQKNEALTQQVENHQAPQVLAAAAAELGMVASPSFGTIDLQTLAVTGNPEPAKEGAQPEPLIGLPEVLTQPVTPAQAQPAEPADNARAAEARDSAPAPAAAGEAAPTEAAAPAAPEADLNGGTIPAPSQRSGQ
ncbi:hypothetical protein H9638_14235 [Arthrobacter sp. Sa2BUA2]|uniref:Cell division protein FtsL n=1 Tax=Arthrobacter pullicola TaxID=2762224 RepID=A0ABR8YLL5_9MICC|nr:hypothetical protein [Arthrobacter pullicola]MBD8044966.1 hypothetical protein [Arthrobacter pullicola]